MGGWGLKGSASQCQKFHPGFELPIRKQIPPKSPSVSNTSALQSLGAGPWQGWARPNGRPEGTSGQHSSLAQRLGCYPGDLTAL